MDLSFWCMFDISLFLSRLIILYKSFSICDIFFPFSYWICHSDACLTFHFFLGKCGLTFYIIWIWRLCISITFVVVHYGIYFVCMGWVSGWMCKCVLFLKFHLHHSLSMLECRDRILKLQPNSSELMEYWMQLFGTWKKRKWRFISSAIFLVNIVFSLWCYEMQAYILQLKQMLPRP